MISCCGCKVDCWKKEALCSLLAFVKPFAIIAFTISCCSIVGSLCIISSWGFIGLRTESRKFFLVLSAVNLITSLVSLPILSILLPVNIQWHTQVVQTLMIVSQYFATCSILWTAIINLHLYSFVKYGREALKWNKFFHLFVWVFGLPATVPIIIGIYLNNDFPMFVPSTDFQMVVVLDSHGNLIVVPTNATEKLLHKLQAIAVIMQVLTFGALLLWLANILSSILIKIALSKFYKHHYLEDDNFKQEFGIDTSLTRVSQLLILAQIPGLFFACWIYFGTTLEWQNPIIIQSSFTLGSSMQGLLNSIYYVAIRAVRLRFWVLFKHITSIFVKKGEARPLISVQ